jgi:beta propeller repeat protein
MRRKKVFIAIVVLLVFGLGVVAEYQRRNRDREFVIPAWSLLENSHDISGHYVAYIGERWSLRVHDLLKGTDIVVRRDMDDFFSSFSFPWILWEDPNGVYAYDLRSSKSFLCGVGTHPVISHSNSTTAVWTLGLGEIAGFDLETRTGFPIRRAEKPGEFGFIGWLAGYGLSTPKNVMIDGDHVVWRRTLGDHDLIDVYNRTSRTVTTLKIDRSSIGSLHISGPYVVWKQFVCSVDPLSMVGSIVVYDIRNGEMKTIKTGVESWFDLDISGNILVWDEKRNGSTSDIYGYNLKTGREFPICTARDDQLSPRVSGNTVVWYDYRYQGWLSRFVQKDSWNLRGKIFRHWPGEEKSK